jgi:eukaryotic-like serine/threonine-protein kinase
LLATGVVIDERYEVERLLGRGGMAEVFQALDLTTEAPVALKLLRDVEPRSVRRFQDELGVLGRLVHPGVVGLRASGTHDGAPYLVLELIEGPSLADLLLDGALGLQRSIAVGRQLAEALAYAHAHDVVHRDLKPANVLCESASERVCLTDFGIARWGDATRMTAPGALMGTAAYLAPEQLDGQIRPSVDVYALGLVVLECLTGVRCYSGSMIEAAVARLCRPPVIPADPPRWLQHTLAAMTTADPAHRPSADLVASAFHLRSADPVVPSTAAVPAAAVPRTGSADSVLPSTAAQSAPAVGTGSADLTLPGAAAVPAAAPNGPAGSVAALASGRQARRRVDARPGDPTADTALATTSELDPSAHPTRALTTVRGRTSHRPAEVGPGVRAAVLVALAVSVVVGLLMAHGALGTPSADPTFSPTSPVEAGPTSTSSAADVAEPAPTTQPTVAVQADENDEGNGGPAEPAGNSGPGNGRRHGNGHDGDHHGRSGD